MIINSYPSIYNIYHKAVSDLLNEDVIIEEKVDGSQISFSINNNEINMRSKGAIINTCAPEGMFKAAVESVNKIKNKLKEGFIYRGEYLQKPKHNVLTYNRTPVNNIIIFDITSGIENYLSPEEKAKHAQELGLETVPLLFKGKLDSHEKIKEFLNTESILGGQKIEGVVIKPANYDIFGRDKKVLLAKFVSEDFKEVHQATWKNEHSTSGPETIIQKLALTYKTKARFNKAVIHLKELNAISNELKDIPIIMAEIQNDVEKECKEDIKQILFNWAWPQLKRKLITNVPEWYKELLNGDNNNDTKNN